MNVLVLGGTRFIGHTVVEQLTQQGHEVTVFHRGKTASELENVRHILGDRNELANFRAEFQALQPDVVLDMFPFFEKDAVAAMDVFTGLTERIVGISSCDVYGAYGRFHGIESGPVEAVLTEDSPLRKTLYPYRAGAQEGDFAYDYDKIPVERAMMSRPELPGTILRLPMVYGPRDGQFRMSFHLKQMLDGRQTILLEEGYANWRWTRGYVEDVAAAITLAATDDRAAGRIYNVGEPHAWTMREWVEATGRAAGWDGEIIVLPREQCPVHLCYDYNTQHSLITDTTRIRTELGYRETVPLEEALRRTYEWEKANVPEERFRSDFDYEAEDKVLASL